VKENPKALDPEAIAAQQRETIPIEERIVKFKELLAEKEVCLFTFATSDANSASSSGQRIFHVGKGAAQNRFRSPILVISFEGAKGRV
jgi:hypothetical protein